MPDNEILKYTKCYMEIYFPNTDVKCDLCPALETYSRRQCRATGEYLRKEDIRGMWCPLLIRNDETGELIDGNEQ